MTNPNPSIYLWYHRKAPIIQNNYLKPVQVGAALAQTNLALIPDNTGASNQISHKNKTYAELTGLYWAWKNDQASSHIGSFHYRRLLALASIPYPPNEHNTVSLPFFLIDNLGHYGLDQRSIEEACKKYDLIIPLATDVRAEGAKSIRDQFHKHHTLKWFDLTLNIAAKLYPQYKDDIREFPDQVDTYFFNMLIARRDIFDEACTFLFSILEALENEVQPEQILPKDQRLYGFMGERILSLFFKIVSKHRPEIRIEHVPCINNPEDKLIRPISTTNVTPDTHSECPSRASLTADVEKPVVPIVLAADDGYAPMLGITINSIITRTTQNFHYDIIVLDSGLSPRRTAQISALVQNRPNIAIRFVTLPNFSLGNAQFYRAQWSFATYNRLLLAEILPYDKIVYLDCDLVVQDDIAKLFKVEMGDKWLAGVPDFFVTAEFRKGDEHDLGGYRSNLRKYYRDLLEQEPASDETFYQAGVLLFNLKALRASNATKQFLEVFYKKNPQFGVDQDILNTVCYKKIFPLNYRWNVVNHADNYLNSVADQLSAAELQQIKAAREDIGCLHFTGAWLAKPFNSLVDFTAYSEVFWQEARQTPWYEECLSRAVTYDLNRVSGALGGHFVHEMNRIGELSLRRTVKRKLGAVLHRCNRLLPQSIRERLKGVPQLYSIYRRVGARLH